MTTEQNTSAAEALRLMSERIDRLEGRGAGQLTAMENALDRLRNPFAIEPTDSPTPKSTVSTCGPICESGGDARADVEAIEYAERLAMSLAEKLYPEVPPFNPMCGDLLGLLTQIDNMSTGLIRDPCETTGSESEVSMCLRCLKDVPASDFHHVCDAEDDITPEMIEAGVRAISGPANMIGGPGVEKWALECYRAMQAARRDE